MIKMIKKIISFVMLFMALVINVKAETFKGGEVIDNVFIKKVSGSFEENKKGQFIVDSSNEYVYCLEPFVKVKNNANYNVYETNFAEYLGISESIWQQINLIVYYGYEYKDNIYDHTDYKWYYITQMLIWRLVDSNASFYFTDYFNGPINENLFAGEIKEINDLVANHFVTPKFDFSNLYLNDYVELEDNAHVLDKFKIDNDLIKVEDNKLKFKITNKNMNFSLSKNNMNTKSIIYVSPDSQNIIKGKMDVPVSQSYEINALEKTGNISIKKYGENINIINNYLYYNEDVLSNIEFTLYDENMNVLSVGKTDKFGNLNFQNLALGKYYLKETNTNNLYIKDDNTYEITLDVDSNNNVIDVFKEIHNKLKKGSITILKRDKNTQEILSNTKFNLYYNGTLIYTGVTNEDGILKIDNLPYGKYYLQEVEAQKGYILDEEIKEVEVLDDDYLMEVYNIPHTSIDINIIYYIECKNDF